MTVGLPIEKLMRNKLVSVPCWGNCPFFSNLSDTVFHETVKLVDHKSAAGQLTVLPSTSLLKLRHAVKKHCLFVIHQDNALNISFSIHFVVF